MRREITCDEVAWLLRALSDFRKKSFGRDFSENFDLYYCLDEIMGILNLDFADEAARLNGSFPEVGSATGASLNVGKLKGK